MDDLPIALAQIGAPAILPLTSIMDDRALEVTIRSIAASALEGIAVLNPDEVPAILEGFRKAVLAPDELSVLRSQAVTILAHFRIPEDRALIKRAMAHMPMMLDITPEEVDEYFAQNENAPDWEQFNADLLEYYDDELV
jgi:hypothetical protein